MISVNRKDNITTMLQPAIKSIIDQTFPSEGAVIDNTRWAKPFHAFMFLVETGELPESASVETIKSYHRFGDISHPDIKEAVQDHPDIFHCIYRFALLRQLQEKVNSLNVPYERQCEFKQWALDQEETLEKEYTRIKSEAVHPAQPVNYKVPALLLSLSALFCVAGYMTNDKLNECAERDQDEDSVDAFFQIVSSAAHFGMAATLSFTASVVSLWNSPTVNRAVKLNDNSSIIFQDHLHQVFGENAKPKKTL